VATILLLAVPFIPGLRDVPRWIPIHRGIWKSWNKDNKEPVGPPNKPDPLEVAAVADGPTTPP
jgi:hypothetical protein